MKNRKLLFYTLSIFLFFSCGNVEPLDNSGLTLPDNFYGNLVIDSLGDGVRHLAVNTNGDIYIKIRGEVNNNGVRILRDLDGDYLADEFGAFGDFSGTGIRIHNGYLYASSKTAIYRYKLTDGEILPTNMTPELVVGGFPEQGEHAAKTFTFDLDGNLYVNVGAPSNACQTDKRTPGSPGQSPCPQRDLQASIWKFEAGKIGLDQQTDGVQYATGIRNAMGLDWNTATNSLFAMQHGRDGLSALWNQLYTDEENAELPAEEFLEIAEGDDYGWPYCYYDPAKKKKVQAPEYGGDGEKVGDCIDAKEPILAFPAHLAPNDLLFYTGDLFPTRYKNGAFIAFHGSWNRAPLPQKGFMVVFVPFENGKISGDWEIFAEGFAELEVVPQPGNAVQRPTGLAQGPDGALYISDSRKGRIYRIGYKKEG